MATTTTPTPPHIIQFGWLDFGGFFEVFWRRSCLEVNVDVYAKWDLLIGNSLNDISLSFATCEYHVTNSAFSFVHLNMVLLCTESISLH